MRIHSPHSLGNSLMQTQDVHLVEAEIDVDRTVRIASDFELLDVQRIEGDQAQLLDTAFGVVPEHEVHPVLQALLVHYGAPLDARGCKLGRGDCEIYINIIYYGKGVCATHGNRRRVRRWTHIRTAGRGRELAP